MVREQEPAQNPLARPLPRPASPEATVPRLTQISSPQPVFGQTTELGLNASPLVAKKSSQPRPTGDKSNFDNLFAPKRRDAPSHYHKPPPPRNPLSQLGNASLASNASGTTISSSQSNSQAGGEWKLPPLSRPRDDAAFPIAKPANPPPVWKAPQIASFSSGSSTNPFFQPQSVFVDPIRSRQPQEEGFNDQHVFGNDRFGTADPFMYLDSGKANENIKALLEGAMDDEDDKPRTRRRKKQAEAKLEDVTKKLQSASLGPSADQEEVEEDDDGTREGLLVKLLPHQIDGVQWMLNKERGTKKVKGILPKGGILADDMGLGKTIQTIALMLENQRPSNEELKASKQKLDPKTDPTTLVIAPLALIKQWEREIFDRIDGNRALKVLVHHGPQRSKSAKELTKYDVVITTYQTVSSEHGGDGDGPKGALFGVHWYRLVLDEAHSIKNRNAKSTKAACSLNAEYRWCLTGTPMQNNLDELQSLIHFLRIKPYDNLEVWREQITKPMANGRGGLAIRRLRAFLSAFMKRRTKDVLKQDDAADVNGTQSKPKSGFKIVARTIQNVEADFSDEERAFYDRQEARTDRSLERMMAGNQISYASALVLLLRLRQACNHPKLLGADLSNEQEALAGSQTPSRKTSKASDMDDIANMLGDLSMGTKRCDICQIELDAQAADKALSRCRDCEDDLQAQERPQRRKVQKSKVVVETKRKTHRKIVVDSDDEEEETEIKAEVIQEQIEEQESLSESEDGDEGAPDLFSSTKIRQLLKILKHDSHSHKYIVFSFFTSMLDLIEPFLEHNDISFVRYDGKMRHDAREAALDSLRNNTRTRVLLCSLRAGSLGLNLTAASRVVILEPFWNPFVEEQAIDRVHRLNQTEDVVVHKLTIKDTVEARIVALQERKRELANATIEGQMAAGAGKLTLNEMLKLFKHDSEKDAALDMIGMVKSGGMLEKGDSTHETKAPGRISIKPDRPYSKAVWTQKEDPIYGRRW